MNNFKKGDMVIFTSNMYTGGDYNIGDVGIITKVDRDGAYFNNDWYRLFKRFEKIESTVIDAIYGDSDD